MTTWSISQAKRNFSGENLKTVEIQGHKRKVLTIGWNSNGTRFASGSSDKTAKIWTFDPVRGSTKDIELLGHTASVDQLCWNPMNPDQLATCSQDKTVRLWDAKLASGKSTDVINTPGDNLNISWSPDGKYIAVGNNEDTISLIDVESKQIVSSYKGSGEVNELAWNKTGEYLFLTTGVGKVEVLKSPELKMVHSQYAHGSNLYSIEFDPTGRYFAVGSADSLVSLWDSKDIICLRTFAHMDFPIRSTSFSSGGCFIAAVSESPSVFIWDVESGEHVVSVDCGQPINMVAFHPKELCFVAALDSDKESREKGVKEGLIKIVGLKER